MAVKMVREVKMWFYVDDAGKNFKVWEAHGGGYWVDVVDAGGDTVETVGYCATMAVAMGVMEALA